MASKQKTASLNFKVLTGIFFLLLAPVFSYLGKPLIEKLPQNFSYTAEMISIDNFYDEVRGIFAGKQYSKTQYSYETVSSENGHLIIKNSFDVKTYEGEPIFSVERLYGIDQQTGRHIPGFGDRDRDGYLFAPKHLKQGQSFTYWHVNYDGPAVMEYIGPEVIDGLKVFKYQSLYEGVDIDQTNNLSFLPGVPEERGVRLEPYLELWIEPVSGYLVKYHDDTAAFYYDIKTGEKLHPWNHFSNTLSEKSIENNVNAAQWEKFKINLIEVFLPLIFVLIGLFFFASGKNFWSYCEKNISPQRMAYVFALLIGMIAILTLIGWFFGFEGLIQPSPKASAMNPMTAVCFVILALGIWLKDKWSGTITKITGIFLMAIALLRILSFLGLTGFSPDLFLFSEKIAKAVSPSRMSLFTSVSFLFLGLSMLATKVRRLSQLRVNDITSFFIAVISLLGFFIYFLGSFGVSVEAFFFSASLRSLLLFFISSIIIFTSFRSHDQYALGLEKNAQVAIVLLIPIISSIILTGLFESSSKKELETEFSAKIKIATEAIENRLDIYINTLEGARGLFAASNEVDRNEWKAYVDSLNLDKNYPGIQGIGHAIFIPKKQLTEHIAKIRSEGFPDYHIKPEGDRNIYSSIIYLEPFNKRNQQAFGFDMFQEPIRNFAMERAMVTGRPQMSGKVQLVQEIDERKQPGFLIYVPIYKKDLPYQTEAERRQSILGYVYSPFRMYDFMDSISTGIPNDIDFHIYDGIDMNESTELYDKDYRVISGDKNYNPKFKSKQVIYIGNHPWAVEYTSLPAFEETKLNNLISLGILVVGIILSILLSAVFYSLSLSKNLAIDFAEKATKDLKISRDELYRSNKMLKEKMSELERINNTMVDRELKMIELKERIKKMKP